MLFIRIVLYYYHKQSIVLENCISSKTLRKKGNICGGALHKMALIDLSVVVATAITAVAVAAVVAAISTAVVAILRLSLGISAPLAEVPVATVGGVAITISVGVAIAIVLSISIGLGSSGSLGSRLSISAPLAEVPVAIAGIAVAISIGVAIAIAVLSISLWLCLGEDAREASQGQNSLHEKKMSKNLIKANLTFVSVQMSYPSSLLSNPLSYIHEYFRFSVFNLFLSSNPLH